MRPPSDIPTSLRCVPFLCPQFAPNRYDRLIEGEGYDRTSLKLLDVQEDLWQVGCCACVWFGLSYGGRAVLLLAEG